MKPQGKLSTFERVLGTVVGLAIMVSAFAILGLGDGAIVLAIMAFVFGAAMVYTMVNGDA